MSFIEVWDESKPAGSRDLSLGDDDIREFKRASRERLAVDHEFFDDETGETTTGYHTKATLVEQASAPSVVTNAGILYTKDVSGATELFYKDAAGTELQLTNAGKILNYAVQGDWQLSSVTTARSGWTNVSATYSNKFMRISATPLTTGGADTHTHAAGSLAGPAHTHTVPASSTGWGTGGAVAGKLTTGQDGGSSATTDQATSSSGTGAVTGTTASGDNVPAFVQVVVFQKD